MGAFALGLDHGRPPLPDLPPVAPAPIASIDPAGWSAQWASGTPPTFAPDSAPQTLSVIRQGFDGTAAAATYTDPRTFTTRVRQVYPNQASFTASTVALDDYVYATDLLPGVANNSTETSPKPVAAWVMPGRSLVGNTLDWEMIAFHRDFRGNRQVACVQVQATDGTTTTSSQTVSTTAISTLCEDACPVEVFKGALDISALATGLVTLRSRVFPWIGGAASVLDSSDQTAAREFAPRHFYKDASRLAAPPLAYVASTGSDSTGIWSTSAATAAATPFLTVGGALTAMDNATRGTPATGGFVDGARIRIVDTVSLGTASTARAQKVAAMIVERAPGTTRANAVVTLTSGFRPRLGVGTLLGGLTEGAVRFFDVTVSRTLNTTFFGETANQLNVQFHNATFANAGTAGTHLANAHDWYFGVALTGVGANTLGQTALQHRLMRGVTADTIGAGLEAWVTVGCQLSNAKVPALADPAKGAIWYANRYLTPSSSSAPIGGFTGVAAGDQANNIVIVQNLIEVAHATASTNGLSADADQAFANSWNVLVAFNTATGYGNAGRWNFLYDEHSTAAVRRTHRLAKLVGNIAPQFNQKGDVFVATSGGNPTEAPARSGHFALHHGDRKSVV